MKSALIGLLLVASAAFGQDARYQRIEAGIARRLNHPDNILSATRALLDQISASGLSEQDQRSLEHELGNAAFAATDDQPSLASCFLDQPDERLHGLALNSYFNDESWLQRPALRQKLMAMLESDTTSDQDRVAIVWVFKLSQAFDDVESIATGLARDHENASFAHQIAEAIVAAHDDEKDRLRASGIRAIREEAIRSGHQCDDDVATAALLAIAEDANEPAWVRGKAIQEFGPCPNSRAPREALLQLLDRRFWFFGASGAHFPVHSLALVIRGLRGMHAPEIRPRLLALRPEVATLESGEREYVEWELANALGEHRGIFHGPVTPYKKAWLR